LTNSNQQFVQRVVIVITVTMQSLGLYSILIICIR